MPAKEYLEKHGVPQTFKDLDEHRLIGLESSITVLWEVWIGSCMLEKRKNVWENQLWN